MNSSEGRFLPLSPFCPHTHSMNIHGGLGDGPTSIFIYFQRPQSSLLRGKNGINWMLKEEFFDIHSLCPQ